MTKLNILYEDNHIIVVKKPVNILSQADSTKDTDMLTLIKEYLKEKYSKPGNVYLGLVHRLDRPVGGVMVFARTSKAASRLSKQIQNHTFKKTYLAIVTGILPKNEDTFVDYIRKDVDGNSIITNAENGKQAKLSYQVLGEKEKRTFIKIHLETGRHHQIRVQFASRGYPLCGDQRYGKLDKTQIALFATQIEFIHPTTQKKMSFSIKPKGGYWTMFTL